VCDADGVRFRFGELELDDERFTLSGPEGPVRVEPQVFDVLRTLIVRRERVVTKDELLDTVWGDRFVSESALTSRIKAARRAVGDDGSVQGIIKTVHGRGYRFVATVTVLDGGPDGDGDGDGHVGGDVGRGAGGGAGGGVGEGSGNGGVRRPLPRLRSAPVGRDGDIGSVVERLRTAPLVTITGSGGMGKTTVALVVAERLRHDAADGVVFVDLAAVPPGADVTRAVSDAAGLEGAASTTIERVADHLAPRPLLLVLDNCEHVLERAAELADRMLARGGEARVLATSRELLGVAGEHVWPLGPLREAGPQLFVERARAAEPRVAWDATDPTVVEICRRLDDVPLALELAAGQLRRFDLDELSRRLDDRLALLAGRAPGDAPRHATMETAIDWSYRLLDPGEQALLRRLSVFPSSFDVGSAEAAARSLAEVVEAPVDETPGTPEVADTPDTPDTPEVPEATAPLVVFGQLVDKSLVVRLPGSGRYRLLETIRMFGGDRLEESGEAASAFAWHRSHVRHRIAATPRLDRWMSARLGARLRDDLDDARQAFRRSLDDGATDDAVEIAVGASFLWRNALGCVEGDAWVDELLAHDLSPRDRVWAHILRADVGQGRGDFEQMFTAAAAAVPLLDAADDPAAACLVAHYELLADLTDGERSRAPLAAALDLAHATGDARLVTLIGAFQVVADVAAGRYAEARDAIAGVERSASEAGYDRFITHWAGWMLGLAERRDVARWWMDHQQAYLVRTGIVDTWITTFSSSMCDALEGGDVATTLSRALTLARQEGYDADPDGVLVLAYAELCAGRPETAAELVGTAVHGRFNATAHYVLYRAVLDRPLRHELGDDVVRAAMARGRGRTAADALAAYGVSPLAGGPARGRRAG
jgi:predicted ATPase/DNA-binding winged helix-turn-helix (wHTH) protein